MPRRILTDGDSIDNYREVTAAERAAIEAEDKDWPNPSQEFNDLFKNVFTAHSLSKRVEFGKYDFDNAPDKSKPYRVYDDEWLSYEDAVQCVANASTAKGIGEHYSGAAQVPCAKILPPFVLITGNGSLSMLSFARANSFIEVVYFTQAVTYFGVSKFSNINSAFAYCSNLRKILGLPLAEGCVATSAFQSCGKLEEIRISFVTNLSFAQSPKLSLASMQYGVKNGSSKGYTITVHPDVYAKLTGDTTNEAAAALTEEELAQWQEVMAAAEAKNILFATI